MSLLLDALKKAEREQELAPAVIPWLHREAPVAGDAVADDVPVLQHGIYVPEGLRSTGTGLATEGVPPVTLEYGSMPRVFQDPPMPSLAFTLGERPADGLWRLYLVLATILVVFLTVGTYAYYRYTLTQYPVLLAQLLSNDKIPPGDAPVVGVEAISAAVKNTAPGEPQSSRQNPPLVDRGALVSTSPKVSPDVRPVAQAAPVKQSTAQNLPGKSQDHPVNVAESVTVPAATGGVVIVKQDREIVNTIVDRAYQHYARQNLDQARILYQEVLQLQANQADALRGLAAIATRQGRIQVANGYYRKLLQLNPGDELAVAGLVSGIQLEDPQQARQMLLAALRQAPESATLYFALGSLYISLQQWRDAQKALQQAVQLDQGNANYLYNLGISHDRLGDAVAALSVYRRAVQAAKAVPGAAFRIADVERRILQLAAAE